MTFISLEYAIFFPIVFIVYWVLPHKFRWILLLISSYYFYMSWNPKYVLLLFFTSVISYIAAQLLKKNTNNKVRKSILFGVLLVGFGSLFFFKYFNFITESLVGFADLFAIKLHPTTLNLLLPIGISFYTFQSLSYVIDVYRGEIEPESNFGIHATFISFFPLLLSGPIERAKNLLPQIRNEKKFDYNLAMYGARQVLWGLFKKVAVADVVAVYVDNAYENLEKCIGLDLSIAIFFFTVQIYCDFSGYSDIAIGSAKLLGINLKQNFASPYFALSVKEFWSRWHISLSTWFRDYVYIPLGGNRCSKIRNYCNLMVTFLISGLWHGASWNFVIWGGIHGLAQIIEKVLNLGKKEKGIIRRSISWISVFVFCNIAWVFFRANSFYDAIYVLYHAISNLADIDCAIYTSYVSIGIGKNALIYTLAVIMIVAIYDYLALKKDVIDEIKNKHVFLRITLEYILIFFIGVALLNNTGTNQFVYFEF